MDVGINFGFIIWKLKCIFFLSDVKFKTDLGTSGNL